MVRWPRRNSEESREGHAPDTRRLRVFDPQRPSAPRRAPHANTPRCRKSLNNRCFRRGNHSMVGPTSSFRKFSKIFGNLPTSVMSPVGSGDPDCMNAARNRPSVFPPFVNIWSDTETAPALWPQLREVSRLHVEGPPHLHRYFRRIATKCVNILLYPTKCQSLCTSKCKNFDHTECPNAHDPTARDCLRGRL